MINRNKIKALIDLIDKEPELKPQLQASLARIIREEPLQFKNVIEENFGTNVPEYIKEMVINIKRDELLPAFGHYFNLKNPSLLNGFVLIAKLVNPYLSQKQILSKLEILQKQLACHIDRSFDIYHKTQLLSDLFFVEWDYRLESLNAGAKTVSLPDIISSRRASSFAMAVLYCCCAEYFDIKADMFDAGGKVMIRLRDKYSYEPVYVDIFAGGRFVGEDECNIYAAAHGFKWSGIMIVPLNSKQIIKRFLGNLIYIYSKSSAGGTVDTVRKCFACALKSV